MAAPTDLLLDQVLYAVVHLQVLQETGLQLAMGSWGQAGCGHADCLPRNAPVQSFAMGQLFLDGNEMQPYVGTAHQKGAAIGAKTCQTPDTETHQHTVSHAGSVFPPGFTAGCAHTPRPHAEISKVSKEGRKC